MGDGTYALLSHMLYVRLYKYKLKTKLSHKKSRTSLGEPISKVKVFLLYDVKPDRVK